jgi:glycosyltransferase involved in cell wall biosynthesis
MNKNPRILRVETGLVLRNGNSDGDILDYHVYADIPRFWRQIEKLLRVDLYLAIRAKMVASRYDIIWAGEKAGIPLSFMRLKQPLVVTTTHMTSPIKAMFARVTGIAKNWAAVGYLTPAEKEFFTDDLGLDQDSLFQCGSANYLHQVSSENMVTDGPIMGVGIAKRDYKTLIDALSHLPGYTTELFVSSRYGDTLKQKIRKSIPKWIYFPDFVPDDELIRRYQRSRFVVLPLQDTTQHCAGLSNVLEAWALSKAIIATKTREMESLVKNGETGILVPPYDVNAMREAIQELWANPNLAYQMGMAGRRFVETYYDPKIVDANIAAMLDRVYRESQSNF